MNRILILITLIIVNTFTAAAAQDFPEFKARVEVSVSASESIKEIVSSYVKSELRSLQDIEIVDRDPEWELQILAMEVSTKSGYKTGIVLSVVILTKFNNQILSAFVSDEYKDSVNKMTSNLYFYPDHWLRVGSDEDLKKICDEFVAEFDSKYIEESRNMHKSLMDSLQKKKEIQEDKP